MRIHRGVFSVLLLVVAAAWGCGGGSTIPAFGDGPHGDAIATDAAPPQEDAAQDDAPAADGAQADAAPQHDAAQSDATQSDVLPQSDGPPQLVTITVAPLNQLLQVDVNTPTTQAFTAHGYWNDLTDRDITNDVTWASSNAVLGTFTGATLHIPGFGSATAEVTTITADLGGVQGKAQLTVVAYRMTGSSTDFFFILPYNDAAGNQTKPLDFHTAVKSLDVFFAMDTTGSMWGEINNLQTALNSIITQIQAQIPDTQFGAGHFEDFPDSPSFVYGAQHGSDCGRGGRSYADQPFELFQAVTSNATAVQAAVNLMSNGYQAPIGCGNDLPEAAMEALYQVATGEGLTAPAVTHVLANHNGVGGVAYRFGTMPVVIPITDAVFHAPGESGVCSDTAEPVAYGSPVAGYAHTRTQTKNALNAICAKVVGIAALYSGENSSCQPLNDEEDFAHATGAVVPPAAWDVGTRPTGCASNQCCTAANGAGRATDSNGQCPLVFEINTDGTGLGTSVVTGLQMLTKYAAFTVTSALEGFTSGVNGEVVPSGHTTSDFIKQVTPAGFTLPPPPPTLPNPTYDSTTFYNVTPGTIVEFNVVAFNDFVPQTTQPQLFRATIKVLAGGCTDLDQRDVFVLVPPRPPQ
jgi:hypothetical protein